ncbi:O-antigen ligase family protein [Patescibacteria group bacterium]|nr:O-antigen ligase family protein [Patescibacteria group bacterium]
MMQHSILKNFLKWGILVLFFIVPFLPLYIASDLLFPYITGRNFAFRLIVEIAFVLWLGLITVAKEYRPKPSKILGAVLIFLIVIGMADFFGANPYHSFWSNYERMEGYLLMLHLGAFFVMLATVLQNKKEWFWYLSAVVLGSMFSAGYALLQKFGVFVSLQGGSRVDGTIGNPAYLAAYLLFSVAISLLLFFLAEKIYQRYIFGATTLFALIIIYFTATRGTTIGLLAGAFAGMIGYLLLARPETRQKKLFRKFVIAGMLLIILVPGALYAMRNLYFVKSSPALTRLTSISLNDKTIRSRFMIWNMAWQGVKERPLLGWGQENFIIIFNKFYNPQLFDQEPWFDRSHNIVFDWLVNGGVLGFISYVSLFGASLISLWQAYRKKQMQVFECVILASLFIAYVINNFFVFDNFNTYFIFFSLLAYIAARASDDITEVALQHKEKRRNYQQPSSSAWALTVMIIAGAGMAFAAYQINVRGYFQSQALIRALQGAGQGKTVGEIDELFKTALEYNSFGNSETREQFANFAQNVVGATQLPQEARLGFLQDAIKEMEKQVSETPYDAKYHLFLANLYLQEAQFDNSFLQKTETELFAAMNASPTRQQIYNTFASFYVNVQMPDKAVEIAEKSILLNPDNYEAQTLLVQIAIVTGKRDIEKKAAAALESAIEHNGDTIHLRLMEYPKLVDAYARVNNYAAMVPYLTKLIALDPNIADFHAELAESYARLGENALAIAEAKQAALLNPTQYQNKVDQFTKSLQENTQPKK